MLVPLWSVPTLIPCCFHRYLPPLVVSPLALAILFPPSPILFLVSPRLFLLGYFQCLCFLGLSQKVLLAHLRPCCFHPPLELLALSFRSLEYLVLLIQLELS